MKQLNAKIVYNKAIATNIYRMRIGSSYLAKGSKPGQFVEIRCSDGVEALLRRPLGVHRIVKGGIELLYEVVGKGTEALSRRRPGEDLDVIGPLGNGFSLNAIRYPLSAILIAGGIGVSPLLALAEGLLADSSVSRFVSLKVFIGACTKEHVLCEKEFKKLGCEVLVATEDGSKGYKGFVTDILREIVIARHEVPRQSQKSRLPRRRFAPPRNDVITIYACGPHPMLREVARIAHVRNIPCQVSLEERMACGVGVCLGCPIKVKTAHGYKMVCKDGPVFNAEEVVW